MSIVKKISHAVFTTLFRLLLFFFVSTLAFILLFNNSSYILSVFEKDNTYERFVPSLIETNKDQNIGAGATVTIGDPEVSEVIQSAFTPSIVESNLKIVVVSTYAWLEGTDQELKFAIDLRQSRELFVDGFTNYAVQRLNNLPSCSTFTSAAIDPFSAECKPPLIDIDGQREVLRDEFSRNGLFLEKTIYTEEDFIDQETAASIQSFPAYYQMLSSSWVFMVGALLILAIFAVLTAKNKRLGVHQLGKGIISTSVSLIFFTLVFSFVIPAFTNTLPIFTTSGEGIDALLNDITLSIGRDLAIYTIFLSVPIGITGIIIFILSKKMNSNIYSKAERKAGVVNSNEKLKKTKKTNKSSRPPIQSSDTATNKKSKRTKYKKYRTMFKKDH